MADYNIKFDWNKISTLGKVRILVEQVVGSPSQAQINAAVASYIDSHPGSLSPLSQATKSALLDIAEHVAYIDANGQSRYDALDAALNAKALLSITAVYTQSGTVYDTDTLDSLKADLVVTAYYDDGTSADVTSASVLSGTLVEGTSTVTVTYQEKTATFDVLVSNAPYIIATQGNDFVKNPSTASNRCSVRVKNRRVAPGDTLSVGCASGYAIYRYAIYADSTASDNGTLNSTEKILYTKMTSDNGENVHNEDIKNNVSPAQNVTNTQWVTAGATTIHNTWLSNGITVGVIGFVIKKTDDSAITPEEAVNAIVISGHTPLE